MADRTHQLTFVYDGWDGYHRSLVLALNGLTADNLAFRSAEGMRTVGEIFLHIGDGRVDWFERLDAPGSKELRAEIQSRPAPLATAEELAAWLENTWRMIEATLAQWTVEELAETYRQSYQGKVYAVTRQWTIWRILTHDVQHGGQLTELLAMQGIEPPELLWLGGHLTEPEVVS